MITLLDRSEGKVIGVRIDGKLVHEDYKRFVPMLEKLIEEHGSFRCYVEMSNYEGFTLRALWDEIKFDTRHGGAIERCAIVGAPTVEKWATSMFKPLFRNAQIRFFDEAQSEEAWDWITAGAPCCAT